MTSSLNKMGFRNGPLGVKSLVSTSPIPGAPRERAIRCAVASAAPAICFRRLRRRCLASVRGQRLGRHMMPSEKTVSLSKKRGPSDLATAHPAASPAPIVPATGLRKKRAYCSSPHQISALVRRERVAAPLASPWSSGNSSHPPISDAGRYRACAPERLWRASCRAVWRHPFPSASAPRNA